MSSTESGPDGFLVSLPGDMRSRIQGWPRHEVVGESAVWFHGYLAEPASLQTELKLDRSASFRRIVHAGWRRWHADMTDRIIGEYAAVIVNGPEAVLIGDRMGLRPLYCATGQNGTVVSTDLGVLVRETGAWRELDEDYLADMLSGGLHLGARTPYRRIRRLGVGEFATWHAGRLRIQGGWRPPQEPGTGTFHDYRERLRATVDRAVAGALTPDGLHAVQVSGGLDSSTVLAVAACHAPVQALSFVHPGAPSSDETSWIRAALEATPATWHPIDATEQGPFTAGPELHVFLPAPSRRILNWATEAAEDAVATRLGISAILTGEGGDAVFLAGLLPWYLADLLRTGRLKQLRRESLRWSAQAALGRSAAFWIRRAAIAGLRQWRSGQTLALEPPRPIGLSAPWLHPTYVDSRDLQNRTTTTTTLRATSVHGQAVLENVVRCVEFVRSRYLFPSAGAQHRHPLLVPDLVDLALTIPWSVAADPRIDRAVQRYAFSGLVGERTLRRRSKSGADEAMLHGLERQPRWREYLCENPQLVARGYVDAKAWGSALRAAGQIGGVAQLYATIQIEVWLRHLHHVGPPALLTPTPDAPPAKFSEVRKTPPPYC